MCYYFHNSDSPQPPRGGRGPLFPLLCRPFPLSSTEERGKGVFGEGKRVFIINNCPSLQYSRKRLPPPPPLPPPPHTMCGGGYGVGGDSFTLLTQLYQGASPHTAVILREKVACRSKAFEGVDLLLIR